MAKDMGKTSSKTVIKPMPQKDVQSESSKLEQENERLDAEQEAGYKRYMEGEKTRLKDQGGSMLGKKKGGMIKSASSRGDGCAQRGKTKGRMI